MSVFAVIFFMISLSPSEVSPSSDPDDVGLSARIISSYSPDSPFYDPNLTPDDRIREGVRSSLARASYLTRQHGAKIASSSSSSSSSSSIPRKKPDQEAHEKITESFWAPIVHRSSPESPFYDPNAKPDDIIRESVRSSLARGYYLSRFRRRGAPPSSPAQYPEALLQNEFLMKYKIGTPPVDAYGILDTGSSVTWLQCAHCATCSGKQTVPMFDPKNSSTYRAIGCASYGLCSFVKEPFATYCDGTCQYRALYGDRTYSRGQVSTDVMTLDHGSSTSSHKLELLFGCAEYNNSTVPGIVGVGNTTASLIAQLNHFRFTYLILMNFKNTSGWIRFGEPLDTESPSTPLLPNDFGYYHLDLKGITVSGVDLQIPPDVFQMSPDTPASGSIIDSGTTFTLLNPKAFDVLTEKVSEFMSPRKAYSIVKSDFKLCFEEEIPYTMAITFHLTNMNLTICRSNAWIRVERMNCLAILKSPSELSVLGMYQQRNLQVGYDLEDNILTFKQISCLDY
ncbi:hypothetical protein RJ640_020600 [Escallonia rubra]|uniref:Peptidase A1 domain-containing protein n=1 Tax=Escallonia rubra TaxID=112253 RepID=A0AA88UN38_9ASTE|nr:hypothetical protein RJ640_020600 [Escallonia rubra]